MSEAFKAELYAQDSEAEQKSLLPRRVPQVLMGIARRGAAGMPHVGKGTGTFLLPTPDKTKERRNNAAKGSFSFGYFSFDCMDAGGRATQGAVAEAAQRKVSRLRVREPETNNRRGSDNN